MASCILVFFVLVVACHVSTAQVFVLENEEVPPARSLKSLNSFYAFSEQDSPDKSLGTPFVRFQGFAAHSKSSKDSPTNGDYQGLQIFVLPFKDLWRVINKDKFCADLDDVPHDKAKHAHTMMLQEVADLNMTHLHLGILSILFKAPTTGATGASDTTVDLQIPILQTGTYTILFANCGGNVSATVSGRVTVRNSYGYLPGNEYRKLPFYKALLLVYALLFLLWIGLSIQGWSGLFRIQVLMGGVLLSGLVEAAIWCATLTDWNSTGVRPVQLNTLAVLASIFKTRCSHMLALVASLGWGVTRPHLECGTVVKVALLCVFVSTADVVHSYFLTFRQNPPMAWEATFISWVPVALLNVMVYFWIFRALTANIDMMRERGQQEKLSLFERLWNILLLALSLTVITVLIQIYVITLSLDVRWRYQWLFSDAGSHVLHASVMVAMMYLWAPTNGSQRYAYTHVASTEAELHMEQAYDKSPAVAEDAEWPEEEDDVFGDDVEEAENDSFWDVTRARNTKVSPEPDLIGLSETG